MIRMVLAADIGATKSLVGAFDPVPGRPRAIAIRRFRTLDYPNLEAMIANFMKERSVSDGSITAACFGVAGPVMGHTCELTNIPWTLDAHGVAARFGFTRVRLLNDLEAMAYGVTVLVKSDVHVLQEGAPLPGGNMALIAAGTGLGEALLHNVNGRFIPSPSEGGHADFAPRNEREIALLRRLIDVYGRADVEHVVSGPGLINIHRVTHDGACLAVENLDDPDAPAAIFMAALEHRCHRCVEALDLFVGAYGAEAGNLALRTVSSGGLFVGGGIASNILPALTDGRFMHAFRDKAPFEPLLAAMPVKIILNQEAGLLGAAVVAAGS